MRGPIHEPRPTWRMLAVEMVAQVRVIHPQDVLKMDLLEVNT